MEYLDKAVAMIETPAFQNFVEGRITWDEYVTIRSHPERKPFTPVLVYEEASNG